MKHSTIDALNVVMHREPNGVICSQGFFAFPNVPSQWYLRASDDPQRGLKKVLRISPNLQCVRPFLTHIKSRSSHYTHATACASPGCAPRVAAPCEAPGYQRRAVNVDTQTCTELALKLI